MSAKKAPKYALHKSTNQARVRINGKDIYLGVYGSPESYQRYAEALARWQSVAEEAPQKLSIRQLTMLYLEFAKGHYRKNGKPTSKLFVIKAALKNLNRAFKGIAIDDFTPKRFKAVRQALIEADLARTTINDYMAVIRRMLRWGVGEELVSPQILIAVEAVKDLQANRSEARETDPVSAVSDHCIDSVKDSVSSVVWAMIQLQRLTGMRPGEVRIMRTCDLKTTGAIWEYRPHSHKLEHKNKQRIVCIGPKAQRIVSEWLRPELDAYLFSSSSSQESRPYTKDAYNRAIRRACETLNLPIWTPNQLRHTFATKARQEFGIEGARVTLGHASAVTSEIYAERDCEAARSVVAMIG